MTICWCISVVYLFGLYFAFVKYQKIIGDHKVLIGLESKDQYPNWFEHLLDDDNNILIEFEY